MPPELNPDDPHQVAQALRDLAARLSRNPLRRADARLVQAAVRHIDAGTGLLVHMVTVADCRTWSIQHPLPCRPGPVAVACPVGHAAGAYLDGPGINALAAGRYVVSLAAGTGIRFTPLAVRHG